MSSPAHPGGAAPDLGDLMHVAFRRLRRGWSEQLAPFELTPHQFRALQAVGGGGRAHEAVLRAAAPEGATVPAPHPHHGPGLPSDADCAECQAEASDGEGLRLKDLAERLRIAPRSATEVVDQLQAKGLVERRPDPADRRATRIVLTAAGAEVRSRVREERRRQAGDYFSVLSARDQSELRRLLAELVRAQH